MKYPSAIVSVAVLVLFAGCITPPEQASYLVSYAPPTSITPYEWHKVLAIYPNATLVRTASRFDRNATVDSIVLTADEFSLVQALIANASPSNLRDSYGNPLKGQFVGSSGYEINFTVQGRLKQISVDPGAQVPDALQAVISELNFLERRRMGGLEGEFCGGIAAFPCSGNLECVLDGSYPDAGGSCTPKLSSP